jgi:hypothetical protein
MTLTMAWIRNVGRHQELVSGRFSKSNARQPKDDMPYLI